jgi:sec-independent protein translocase protein TatA
MGFLRGNEVWVVLIIALLLFGGKRLPDLARGMGRSLRIFKSEIKATEDPKDETTDDQSSKK